MFAIRSKAGVPVPSILFHGLCCALLATLDFASVLQISNVFAQLSCLLNYTTLLRLRYTQPERSRPYSVPFSLRNGSLQAFVAVPIVMCLMGIFLLEWLALVLALVWIVLVLVLYYVSEKTDWLNRCTPQACTPQTSDEADNSMRRLLSRQVGRSDSFSQAAASVEMVDRDIQEELDKLNYNRPTRC
jgi:amino acid transporter